MMNEQTALLRVEGLEATVDGLETPILKGVDMTIQPGEVHALMGQNGSGKSTLSHVLAGRPDYTVTGGSVTWEGEDLLGMAPEDRVAKGLFLSFQYPTVIPGVNNAVFLRTAVNEVRKARGLDAWSAADFLREARSCLPGVGLGPDFLKRGVNDGFSGGEKKRNEMLQMALLQPKLAILDEVDSGLDIDALQTVAQAVNRLRDAGMAVLVITHYQRLLDHVVPDHVHVMMRGRVVRSGDASLAHTLEAQGYGWLDKTHGS